MKTCSKCNLVKPPEDFYKHPGFKDGRDSKCKECAKKLVKQARDKNIERVREYDRIRAKLPHRISKNVANTRSYRARNEKRARCMAAVAYALRTGKLKKLPCFICGDLHVEGHHPDYDAPLDVVWLCPAHHKEIHLKQPRDLAA